MRELKRNRINESAYNSALNEVRYDVEHEFKPITLPGDWYIGLDDVKYDYDELSATLFVLNDKDEVVDEETITIPVDAMKDYTTVEIASLKDSMLEKINEVAENLKDSWNVGRGYYESRVKRSRKIESSNKSDSVDLLKALQKSDSFNVCEIKGMTYPTWFVYSSSELFAFVLSKDSKGYYLWNSATTPELGDNVDFYDFFGNEGSSDFPEYSQKVLRLLRGDTSFRNTFK